MPLVENKLLCECKLHSMTWSCSIEISWLESNKPEQETNKAVTHRERCDLPYGMCRGKLAVGSCADVSQDTVTYMTLLGS